MPIAYLDAVDIASGEACQIELDEASTARERRRNLFSMTDEPRPGVPLRARENYGWEPVKR